MKYLYQWDDWNLFHVEEVNVVDEDVFDTPMQELALVKTRNSRTILAPRKHLFDTYEEAYQFGLEHTPSIS